MSKEEIKRHRELAQNELTRLLSIVVNDSVSREDKDWAKIQADRIYEFLFPYPIIVPEIREELK